MGELITGAIGYLGWIVFLFIAKKAEDAKRVAELQLKNTKAELKSVRAELEMAKAIIESYERQHTPKTESKSVDIYMDDDFHRCF